MRIVAVSDQHGFLAHIPPCDLLTVAGHVCPDRFGPFMAVHAPYQQKAWFDFHRDASEESVPPNVSAVFCSRRRHGTVAEWCPRGRLGGFAESHLGNCQT